MEALEMKRQQANHPTISGQMKELISDVAEQLVESNLMDEEDELLTIQDSCLKLGVDEPILRRDLHLQVFPSERHGRRRFIRMSVVEMVKDLMELHGRNWRQHAKFDQQSADEAMNQDKSLTPLSGTSNDLENGLSESDVNDFVVDDEGRVLVPALRIKKRAEELLSAGKYQASAELFKIFTECFEFK